MDVQEKSVRHVARRWGAALTALVIVASGLTALPAQAQKAKDPEVKAKAAKHQKPAKDLPAAPSAPSPVVPLQIPTGDFSNPPPPVDQLATRRPDVKPRPVDLAKTTVDDAQTTPTKKVHVAADGTKVLEVNPSPVRFKDPAGKWQDIDLTVTPAADGTLGAKSAAKATKLSPQAQGTVAVLDTDAGPIGLRHPDASAAPATTKDRRSTYKGALAGRDVALDLNSNGVEETVSLPDAKAATTYTDELTLPAGVTAKERDGGGVSFLDAKGAEVATFAPGLAFDSAGPGGGPGSIGSVSVKLLGTAPTAKAATPDAKVLADLAPGAKVLAERSATAASVATVEVSVDAAWAGDKARVYPLHIDPLFTYVANAAYGNYDGLIVNGAEQNTDFGTNPYLAVGTDNGGSHVARSILWFNVAGLVTPNTWVTEAHLSIWNWSSASTCAPRGVTVSGLGSYAYQPVTWNRQPGLDAVGAVSNTSFARSGGYSCGEGFQNLNATNLAQRWLMNNDTNYGMELRAGDEADTSSFKWFYAAEAGGAAYAPALYVTLGHLANSSVPDAPADAAVVSTATPVLSTLAGTDPDGGPVKLWFRATPSPDAENGAKVVDSGWLDATPPGVPCAAGRVCFAALPERSSTGSRTPGTCGAGTARPVGSSPTGPVRSVSTWAWARRAPSLATRWDLPKSTCPTGTWPWAPPHPPSPPWAAPWG